MYATHHLILINHQTEADNKIVAVFMTTDIPGIYRKWDKEKKRIDIEYLILPKQQQQLKESIKKEINDRKLKETISTQERWKLLPNIMKETAGKTLGRKDRMERTNDRKV